MTTPPVALLLAQAERRLLEHVDELGRRLDVGENVWTEYLEALTVLHALVPEERRPLATTKDLAEKYSVTPRTIRKWAKRGKLRETGEQLGQRGTAAIRWKA